ncbi:MAG: DHH family phosphoesterase [Archaeoglobus sp.]|nr:DHH family phosphoesterase [Archaeoglobus sp.]
MEEFIDGRFFDWVDDAAAKIKSFKGEDITIVHHNDADGICSAAILSKLCEYLGHSPRLICIEKVHPAIVEKIHEKVDGVIIYTDLGGLAAKMIDEINAGRSYVFIIDHHPAKPIKSDHVFVLDPELGGISGDVFVSAATLNYIFFRRITEEAKKYAYIAVIGAVGDYHDRSGGVLGFDRFALQEAIEENQVKVKLEQYKERYFIRFFNEYADVVAKYLTDLGACGYGMRCYRDAVRVLFEGFDEETLEEAKKLDKLREEKFHAEIERLKANGFNEGDYTQWFHVEDRFSPLGVKSVGEFCQLIKDMIFVDGKKYLIGFQNMPRIIPDIGEIEWNAVKMSGRAPTQLERLILRGVAPGLELLVPEASKAVGGFADATHKIAAACVIERGKEEEFIQEFEKLVRLELKGRKLTE